MILSMADINSKLDISLGKVQSHENMAIVPINTTHTPSLDLLTLKKGLELGLVEVTELDESSVNIISIKNKAVTPLILIDGEEIVGSKQNRIVNSTTIIAPKTSAKVNVSCTEKGRWAYTTPKFAQSDYMANHNTRYRKEVASRISPDYQSEVWDSIACLESRNSFSSKTHAMSESYDNLKKDHDKFLNAFTIEDNQSGVVIILDGEIKGFELLYNSQIYREYHKKILRSYLIDNENKNPTFTVDLEVIGNMMEDACKSAFNPKETNGLENAYEFENSDGLGTLYTYKNELIHWSFFKNIADKKESESNIEEWEDIII